MSLVVDPSMEDLPEDVMSMEDLPVPLMVDILSRLPVKTIIHCKCVCKKWRNIFLDSYFADIQRSRSPAGFMLYDNAGILKWVEVEDEHDHHNLLHDPVMSIDLDLSPIVKDSPLILPVGSVNGLVCMWQCARKFDNYFICNPITREYMILPRPQYSCGQVSIVAYAFGVGSLSQEYKVIRVLQTRIPPHSIPTLRYFLSLSEAEVYTLGTGQWRSLGHVPYWLDSPTGSFLNGHAHFASREKICSFNFDNETFELFPSRPCETTTEESMIHTRRLGVLKGCLCQCDCYRSKLTVWVMKEYGIKESWHKELVIQLSIPLNFDMLALQPAFPVEGFKDGTILMETSGINLNLIVYCPRRKAITETEIFEGRLRFVLAYCPSFHRLQNFENESVHVF